MRTGKSQLTGNREAAQPVRANLGAGDSWNFNIRTGDRIIIAVQRITLIALYGFIAVCLSGCVISRRVSSPTEEKLRVQSQHPDIYTIRVATQGGTNDFAVPSDGRVTVTVPGMGPGCTMYLFGVRAFAVNDESPYTWRVIHVLRGTNVVRSLSLKQAARLRHDTDGYRVVKVD